MSKRHVLALLAIISGAAITAAAQQPALKTPSAADPAAQVAAGPNPAPPPADPFVRDQRAAKATPPPPPDRAEAPVNLLTTVETWSMSRADFVALLDVSTNQDAPFARLEELAKAGKAKLVGLTALSTKSGQRAVVESIDEFRYAIDFARPERAGEIAIPTAWEKRNTGDTLEVEPVLGPDGTTIDVNLVPKTVRFGGFSEWRAEAGGEPVAQPKFHVEDVNTSVTVQSGRPVFLSTATPTLDSALPQPAADVRLLVLRVSAQAAPPPLAATAAPTQCRLEFLLYTLGRAAAREVLIKSADSAKSHAAVRELVARGEAQIEVASAFTTKSGQRVVNEEITEMPFPDATEGPSSGLQKTPAEGRAPASASKFVRRNVGVTVECEPVIDTDGRFVDISIVPQVDSFGQMLKAEGIAARYPAQPLITTRKITTSAITAVGIPLLLGAMNRPQDTGVNDQKDDGKTTLAYLRVTPVAP